MQTNPQLDLAYQFIERTNRHLFLTGKAGTGKTTFLRRIQAQSPKRMVVVAPTGVAAINAGGVTIHSFFQMPFGPHLPKEVDQGEKPKFGSGYTKISKTKINIIRSMDLLIIDEISMVRADLLDGIDEVLRRYRYSDKPFGGVQMLMIGDIRQLAPIIKDDERALLQPYYNSFYFFGSRALQQTNYVSIELKHIYRQSDAVFINLLNKVRDNILDEETVQELNKRYKSALTSEESKGYIQLTTHNYKADKVNQQELVEIDGSGCRFTAKVQGDFPEYLYPTGKTLELKRGAQVMFVKNDTGEEKQFYNGKIGVIEQIDANDEKITIRCPEDDATIEVGRLTWENTKYTLNPNTKEIEEEIVGSFKQIPLKLAWAITIHKSQGLTFDKAIIDARDSFAHGQVYVALSRCRSLEGLLLSSPIEIDSVKSDAGVSRFSKAIEENPPDENLINTAQTEFYKELFEDLFNFRLIAYQISSLRKQVQNNSGAFLDGLLTELQEVYKVFSEQIFDVAEKFKVQLYHLFVDLQQSGNTQALFERMQKAGSYFSEHINVIINGRLEALSFDTDNKQVNKDIEKSFDRIKQETSGKLACFENCKKGFELQSYLIARSTANIEEVKKSSSSSQKTNKKEAPDTIKYPELYDTIRNWRNALAKEKNVPVYMVISQKAMAGIANFLPATAKDLEQIKGLGKKKISEHGAILLEMIEDYCKNNEIEFKANFTIAFEEKVKEKKPKAKKEDTKKVTYDLFKQGKKIEEIAKERGLVRTTIENHLAHFIEKGELEISHFLNQEQVREIVSAIEEMGDVNRSALKEFLDDKYDYSTLLMAVAHFKKLQNSMS